MTALDIINKLNKDVWAHSDKMFGDVFDNMFSNMSMNSAMKSFPFYNVVKYGKGEHNRLFKDKLDSHRLLLAATKLTLTHPITNKLLNIECPLEDNMSATLQKLNKYQMSL